VSNGILYLIVKSTIDFDIVFLSIGLILAFSMILFFAPLINV